MDKLWSSNPNSPVKSAGTYESAQQIEQFQMEEMLNHKLHQLLHSTPGLIATVSPAELISNCLTKRIDAKLCPTGTDTEYIQFLIQLCSITLDILEEMQLAKVTIISGFHELLKIVKLALKVYLDSEFWKVEEMMPFPLPELKEGRDSLNQTFVQLISKLILFVPWSSSSSSKDLLSIPLILIIIETLWDLICEMKPEDKETVVQVMGSSLLELDLNTSFTNIHHLIRSYLSITNGKKKQAQSAAETEPLKNVLLETILQIIEKADDSSTGTICSLFTIYMENCTKSNLIEFINQQNYSCKRILKTILKSLTSTNLHEGKQSIFILQSLNEKLEDLIDEKFTEEFGFVREFLLLALDKKLRNEFWTDYFSLLEILDEKQSHIIQPYLPKYDNLAKFKSSENISKWLMSLIYKMIHHDNRIIVETGVNKFFELEIGIEEQNEDYINFLQTNLTPILKKHIGSWIFSEGELIYTKANQFANILEKTFPQSASKFLLNSLLTTNESGNSSFAILFFVETLKKCVELNSTTTIHEITEIISSMGKLLKMTFSIGLDRFINSLIEDSLVEILQILQQFDTSGSDNIIPTVEFIGLLSRTTFLKNIHNLSPILKNYTFMENLTARDWTKNGKSGLGIGLGRIIYTNYSSNTNAMKLAKVPNYLDILYLDPIEWLQCFNLNAPCFRKRRSSGTGGPGSAQTNAENSKYIIKKLSAHFVNQINAAGVNGKAPNPIQGILLLEAILKSDMELVAMRSELNVLMNFLLGFARCTNGNASNGSGGYDETQFHELRLESLCILLKYKDRLSVPLTLKLKDINKIINIMDTCGPVGIKGTLQLVSLPKVLKTIAQDVGDEEAWLEFHSQFADSSWKYLFEVKNPGFLTSLRIYFDYLLHLATTEPSFIYSWKQLFQKRSTIVFENATKIPGIVPVLMESIYSSPLIRCAENLELLGIDSGILGTCIRVSYFGNALLQQNRITFNILDYVVSKNDLNLNSSTNSLDQKNGNTSMSSDLLLTGDAKARLQAVLICGLVLNSTPTSQEPSPTPNKMELLKECVITLLDTNEAESKKHKRYYGNSTTHRIKNRIAQGILVFQPLFNQEIASLVNSRILKALADESPQPSVRYFMEWTVIKNLLNFSELHEQFFETVKELCKQRPGFAAFVTTICLHVSLKLGPNSSSKSFHSNSLKLLVSFLMGQHVVVRVYSSIAFQKIYEYIKDTTSGENTTQSLEYTVIYDTLIAGSLTSSGNFNKLTDAVQDDFWLNHFDPCLDFNMEMIYFQLPKITEIPPDEILQTGHFNSLKNENWYMPWESTNNSKAKSLSISFYKLKSHAGNGRELGEIEPIMVTEPAADTASSCSSSGTYQGQALQKKINPWKILPISSEDLADFPLEMQQIKDSQSNDDGLIVVASLVDRIPNLGGLCRTCEIFNVSKFVISSLNVTMDQQFKNLSVSAQRWIDILEIPVKDLELFLKTYKAKGYHILGIEQAVGSVSLNEYKFPKKSILLLGNEKYGIPTNLLHLVDQCLEIQQLGIVRSLNVHVTGAICIYQYATQHVI